MVQNVGSQGNHWLAAPQLWDLPLFVGSMFKKPQVHLSKLQVLPPLKKKKQLQLLMMEEILHQLIGRVSQYVHAFTGFLKS